MKLLAASQTREKEDVDTVAFRGLIERLRERFDYVLIDCPAGIEKGFQNASPEPTKRSSSVRPRSARFATPIAWSDCSATGSASS